MLLRLITRLVLLLVLGVLASGVGSARIQDRVWPPAASAEKLASWGGHPETAVLRQAAAMQAAETQQAASSLGYDFASGRTLAPENVGDLTNKGLSRLREQRLQAKLEARFGADKVLSERTLRDASGVKVRDPITGTGRRVDFIVLDDLGNARFSIEATSRNQVLINGKADQLFKESTIRSMGGTFVRDPATRRLIDVSNVPTRVIGLEPLQ